MATDFNELTSGVRYGNTGAPDVSYDLDKIKYALLVPKDSQITRTNLAAIKTFLKELVIKDDRNLRGQSIGPFVTIEDVSTETTRETSGYGFQRVISEGRYGWNLTFWKGAKDLHTALRKFNNRQDDFDVLLIDETNVLIGTRVFDTTGKEAMKGFSISQIWTDKMTMNDGSAGTKYMFSIMLDSVTELNDDIFVMELGFNYGAEVKSLVDVHLSDVTPTGAASGVYTIAPRAGKQNLVAVYPTVLNSTALWTAKRADTSAAVTVASAAATAGVGFQLTLTVTGIPSGTAIYITGVAPSGLAAAGVKGFEFDTVTVLAP